MAGMSKAERVVDLVEKFQREDLARMFVTLEDEAAELRGQIDGLVAKVDMFRRGVLHEPSRKHAIAEAAQVAEAIEAGAAAEVFEQRARHERVVEEHRRLSREKAASEALLARERVDLQRDAVTEVPVADPIPSGGLSECPSECRFSLDDFGGMAKTLDDLRADFLFGPTLSTMDRVAEQHFLMALALMEQATRALKLAELVPRASGTKPR